MDSPLSFIEIMMYMKENKANDLPLVQNTRKYGLLYIYAHIIYLVMVSTPIGEHNDTFEDRESKRFNPHALKGVRNKKKENVKRYTKV